MHAKKTRMRKKQQMDSLGARLAALQDEGRALRRVVEERHTAFILLGLGGPCLGVPEPPSLDPAALGAAWDASAADALGLPGLGGDDDDGAAEYPTQLDDDGASGGGSGEGGKRTRRRGKYTPAERETIRRERNKMHAKKTRDRRKQFLDGAEVAVQRLVAANAKLRGFMHAHGMADAAVPVPPPLADFDESEDGGSGSGDESEGAVSLSEN